MKNSNPGKFFPEVINSHCSFSFTRSQRMGWLDFSRITHRVNILKWQDGLKKLRPFLSEEKLHTDWWSLASPKNSLVVIFLIRSADLRMRNKVAGYMPGFRKRRAKVKPACRGSDAPPILGYTGLLARLPPCPLQVFAPVSSSGRPSFLP